MVPSLLFWYARHGRKLGSESLLRTLTRRTASRRQLRRCEPTWKGSWRAKPGLDGQKCVKRRGAPDELASDSEVQKGSKRLYVNAAMVRGKRSYLIRGGLSLSGGQKSAEAIVVDGVTTIQGGWGNSTTGRRAKRSSRWTEGRETTTKTAETWQAQGRCEAKR